MKNDRFQGPKTRTKSGTQKSAPVSFRMQRGPKFGYQKWAPFWVPETSAMLRRTECAKARNVGAANVVSRVRYALARKRSSAASEGTLQCSLSRAGVPFAAMTSWLKSSRARTFPILAPQRFRRRQTHCLCTGVVRRGLSNIAFHMAFAARNAARFFLQVFPRKHKNVSFHAGVVQGFVGI